MAAYRGVPVPHRKHLGVSNKCSIHWLDGLAQRAAELDGNGAGAHRQAAPRGAPLAEPNGDGGDSPAWSRKRGELSSRRTSRRPGSSVPYAELHAHSAYSFLDGASTPEELVEEAARLDLRAIALTDHDGLYGVVRFAEAAKELDMATVFGAELSLGDGARTEDPDPPGPHLLVLARGPEGYRRLSRQLARRIWPAARRASRATTSTR